MKHEPIVALHPFICMAKFAKRNKNYKLVWKGNKLALMKPCKTFPKLHPNVGLDPCIFVANLVTVIVTTS